MSEETQVKAFFENYSGTFQHIVVSSAMPGSSVLLEENTAEARKTFDTKYWGSYYVAKYGIPKLAERGSLIFVTGVVPFKVMTGTATMAAINSALIGLARTLALEVGPRRVNVVSPGITDTSAWEKLPDGERNAFLSELDPIDTSSRVSSRAHTRPRLAGLLTQAADGGLKSPPVRRFRWAVPHLSHSSAMG